MSTAGRVRRAAIDEFDGAGFAAYLRGQRHARALSTRDIARRAGISQAYVVALERERESADRLGPTPTVDIVARLARALHREPVELFSVALRTLGHHVLLVTDERASGRVLGRSMLAAADTWIHAAPPGRNSPDAPPDGVHTISVHGDRQGYDPTQIAETLTHELRRLDSATVGGFKGQRLGLVFTEMSPVIAELADPSPVLDFEHRWPAAVSTAAASVGARVEWNVCVYSIESLRRLPEPVEGIVDLFSSHDMVLATRGTSISRGASAVRRILHQLRPESTSSTTWKLRIAELTGAWENEHVA